MKITKLNIKTSSQKYPIIIGLNLVSNISKSIKDNDIKFKKCLLVVDKKISKNIILKIKKSLKKKCFVYYFNANEINKNLKSVNKILDVLLKKNFSREDCLISIGGGITGDVSGLVASLFKRGIKFINIPSTLLAQVDSSIGGKTGINIPQGKNLVGTIYQPKGVFIDQNLLNTLPEEEVISGLGEIIKYGVILDLNFFNSVSDWIKDLSNFPFKKAIEICCRLKAEIVSKDEKDNGIRAILNFGHTIGHSLELKYGFNKIKHGEAVAYGMLSASYISFRLKKISQNEYNLLNETIRSLPLPKLNKLDHEELLTFVKRDKKYIKGKLNFVTLKNIGSADITNDIQDQLIIDSIKIL